MSEESSSNDDGPFERFMLGEYSNLAQAFFSAGTTITQFFQYYLIALGVPLTAAGIAVKVSTGTIDIQQLEQSTVAGPLGWFFVIVGVVGWLIAGYITNLRLDALLYARSVNGICNYFYTLEDLPREIEVRYRVLPRDVDQPGLFEPRFFLFVVLSFALLNGVYIALGLILLTNGRFVVTVGVFAVSVIAHVVLYAFLADRRKSDYEQYRDKFLHPEDPKGARAGPA